MWPFITIFSLKCTCFKVLKWEMCPILLMIWVGCRVGGHDDVAQKCPLKCPIKRPLMPFIRKNGSFLHVFGHFSSVKC